MGGIGPLLAAEIALAMSRWPVTANSPVRPCRRRNLGRAVVLGLKISCWPRLRSVPATEKCRPKAAPHARLRHTRKEIGGDVAGHSSRGSWKTVTSQIGASIARPTNQRREVVAICSAVAFRTIVLKPQSKRRVLVNRGRPKGIHPSYPQTAPQELTTLARIARRRMVPGTRASQLRRNSPSLRRSPPRIPYPSTSIEGP